MNHRQKCVQKPVLKNINVNIGAFFEYKRIATNCDVVPSAEKAAERSKTKLFLRSAECTRNNNYNNLLSLCMRAKATKEQHQTSIKAAVVANSSADQLV